MPQVPVVNFYEALNFEPNSTLEVKLEVGDDYGKWGLITIEVSAWYLSKLYLKKGTEV